MIDTPDSDDAKGRRRFIPVAALVLCALATLGLGLWQIQRLAWKEALIAHVAKVSTAAPLDGAMLPFAPPPAMLSDLEYRHLALSGHFEPQGTALVTALTELGGGYWVLAPLRLSDGRVVWINRGYMPLGTSRAGVSAATNTGPVRITGLLRKPEPKGAFLRANVPAEDRWYSRDIAALSAARGIKGVHALWFVDAQGTSQPGQPVPGLTVLAFPNNHLHYALTWFALCGMSLLGIWLVLRQPDG